MVFHAVRCIRKTAFESVLPGKKCTQQMLLKLSRWHISTGYVSLRNFGQPVKQTHPHLIKEGEVTPGISKAEFRTRRDKLIYEVIQKYEKKNEPKHHLMIIPSSCQQYMTYHVPYTFRQNSDFLYLSGFQEPDSVLVIHTCTSDDKNNPLSTASALFVRENTKRSLLWDGPRSGVEGTKKLTGVDVTFDTQSLGSYLFKFLEYYPDYVLWYDADNPVNNNLHTSFLEKFVADHLSRNKMVENPKKMIEQLRLVKSKAEIELMKKSADITAEAFIETMKFSYPNVKEAHLYAMMDFACRIRDAEMLAYIPVVAGGNRANIIHYISNNQTVKDGEMVLMDAGCEYHGYSSDVTRTWPVSGKFTAPQRALYEAVLRVQETCIKMCHPERSIHDIYSAMIQLLGIELIKLKIIPDIDSITDSKQFVEKVHRFCPTNVGHFVGMDIHDTPTANLYNKLLPGSCLAIEPGIYIPQDCTDVPPEFQGMGIRIEDNVLVSNKDPVVLTAKLPKHPDDIEQIMAK